MNLTEKDIERFWSKVEKRGSHLIWKGTIKKPSGYGRFKISGIDYRAHRVAWFIEYNQLPCWPLTLDHICKVRNCVNVAHIREATPEMQAANAKPRQRRAPYKGDHCKYKAYHRSRWRALQDGKTVEQANKEAREAYATA